MASTFFDDLDTDQSPVGQIKAELDQNPLLPRETAGQYTERRATEQAKVYNDQARAQATQQRQQDQVQKATRIKARDFFGQAKIPTYEEGGMIKPVQDEAGKSLTEYDKTSGVGWDSFGKPRSVSKDAAGAPVLRDPYADAPKKIEKDGTVYAAPKGLPWQPVGKDAATVQALDDRTASEAATSLHDQARQDASALKAQEKEHKARMKALSDKVPTITTATDDAGRRAAIDSTFDAKYAEKAANATTGYFGTGERTPEANALRAKIDSDKAAAHAELDNISQTGTQLRAARADVEQRASQAQQLRGQANDAKLAKLNAQRVAAGLAPIQTGKSLAVAQQPATSATDSAESTQSDEVPPVAVQPDQSQPGTQAAQQPVREEAPSTEVVGQSSSPQPTVNGVTPQDAVATTRQVLDAFTGPGSIAQGNQIMDDSVIRQAQETEVKNAQLAAQGVPANEALSAQETGPQKPTPSALLADPEVQQFLQSKGSKPISQWDWNDLKPFIEGTESSSQMPLEQLGPIARQHVAKARASGYKIPGWVDTAMTPSAEVLDQWDNNKAAQAMFDSQNMQAPGSLTELPDPNSAEVRSYKIAHNVTADTANFFTSPVGIATLGLGAAPKALQGLVAAIFAGQALKEAPEKVKEIIDAKTPEERDAAITGTIETLMVLGGTAGHAAGRPRTGGLAPGETRPPSAPTDEQGNVTRPTPPEPAAAPSGTQPAVVPDIEDLAAERATLAEKVKRTPENQMDAAYLKAEQDRIADIDQQLSQANTSASRPSTEPARATPEAQPRQEGQSASPQARPSGEQSPGESQASQPRPESDQARSGNPQERPIGEQQVAPQPIETSTQPAQQRSEPEAIAPAETRATQETPKATPTERGQTSQTPRIPQEPGRVAPSEGEAGASNTTGERATSPALGETRQTEKSTPSKTISPQAEDQRSSPQPATEPAPTQAQRSIAGPALVDAGGKVLARGEIGDTHAKLKVEAARQGIDATEATHAFVDDQGNVLGRDQAGKIAEAAGQRRAGTKGPLQSEHLESPKPSPETENATKLASAALKLRAKELKALDHPEQFDTGETKAVSGIEINEKTGRITINPEKFAKNNETAAKLSIENGSAKNLQAARLEHAKTIIGEEVEHLKTVAFENSNRKENAPRIKALVTTEPEIAAGLAKSYKGWENLTDWQKGHEIFRAILQTRNDPHSPRPITESTYRLIQDFVDFLKKHVANLGGDTAKLVKELDAMLKERMEKAEPKEKAPTAAKMPSAEIQVGEKVRSGSSPQRFTVEEVMPRQKGDLPEETYYRISNDETGAKSVVESKDITRLKENAVPDEINPPEWKTKGNTEPSTPMEKAIAEATARVSAIESEWSAGGPTNNQKAQALLAIRDMARKYEMKTEDLRKQVLFEPAKPKPDAGGSTLERQRAAAKAKTEAPAKKVAEPKVASIPEPKAKKSKLKAPVADTPAEAVEKVAEHVADVKASEGARPAKEIKAELISRLKKAIKNAPKETDLSPEQGAALAAAKDPYLEKHQAFRDEKQVVQRNAEIKKVAIDAASRVGVDRKEISIPGDGTFKVWNTKQVLSDVLRRVEKMPVSDNYNPFAAKSSSGNNPTDVKALADQASTQLGGKDAAIEWLRENSQNATPTEKKINEAAIEFLKKSSPENLGASESKAAQEKADRDQQPLFAGKALDPIKEAIKKATVPFDIDSPFMGGKRRNEASMVPGVWLTKSGDVIPIENQHGVEAAKLLGLEEGASETNGLQAGYGQGWVRATIRNWGDDKAVALSGPKPTSAQLRNVKDWAVNQGYKVENYTNRYVGGELAAAEATPEDTLRPADPKRFKREDLVPAYQSIAAEKGFPAIPISELQKRTGVDMAVLKATLKNEHNKGNAVLSAGDWSISTPEERAGNIKLHDQDMLQVRFPKKDWPASLQPKELGAAESSPDENKRIFESAKKIQGVTRDVREAGTLFAAEASGEEGARENRNIIQEKPPFKMGAPKESDLTTEKGYTYRVVSDAELKDARDNGFFLPREGKSRGGREGVKHWVRGGERAFPKEGPAIVRVPDSKISTEPGKFVDVNDAEVWRGKEFVPVKETVERPAMDSDVPPGNRDAFAQPLAAAPTSPQPLTLPGKIDSVFKRVVKGGRFFWEGAADTLDRAGYKDLAKATKEQAEVEGREWGKTWKPFREVLDGLDGEQMKTAKREFEQYFRDQESGRRAKAEADFKNISLGGRDLIRAWKIAALKTGSELRKLGVEVQDGDKWRPIGNLGDRFFPRKINQATQRVLQAPEKFQAEWNKLVQDLVKNGNIKDPAEATRFLKETVWKEDTKNDYYANIEQARKAKLPESWLDYKFDEIAPWYATHFARRVGQIEAYGQEHKGGDMFDKAMASIPKREDYKSTQEYVQGAKDAAYFRNDNTGMARSLRNLQTFATGAYLSNPMSAIRNAVSGVGQTGIQYGPGRTLKASWDTLMHYRDRVNDAKDMGVLRDDLMQMMMETRDIQERKAERALRKVTGAGLQYTGFNLAENFARATSMTAAKTFARDAARRINADPLSDGAQQAKAFLIRNDADPALIAKENGSGPATDRFVRGAVREGQFGYKFDQTPLYQSNPIVKFATQFQKWGTQMARFLAKHVVNPAIEGTDIGNGQRIRTLKPLLYAAAFAIGGGELLYYTRQMLTGRNRPDASLEETKNALDQNTKEGINQLASRLFSDVINSGTAGVFGDYAGNLREFATRGRAKSPFNPPGVQAFGNIFNAIVTLKQQKQLTGSDILDIVRNQFPGAKFAQDAKNQITGNELAKALNTESSARRAGMRMAQELGLPVQQPFSAALPTKTVMTPVYKEIGDALLTGDHATASRVWNAHLASLPAGKRAQAMDSLKASIAAKVPIKVGGLASAENTDRFQEWAGKRLPKDEFNAIMALNARYWTTAQRAGLVKGAPVSKAKRAPSAADWYGVGK